MTINREKLLELYNAEIDFILDHCESKIFFSAEECVNIVANIIEKNPELIEA
jgi:DNA polymerase III delta subunit